MKLTDRIQASGASLTDIIHIVITSDTSQNSAGSSFKIPMSEYAALFGSGTASEYWISGSTGTNSIKANNSSSIDATGNYAEAEGRNTIASGSTSHAEGNGSIAGGGASHAEGQGTKAFGGVSHTEGFETTAIGDYSHAGGWGSKSSKVGEWSRSGNGPVATGFGQYGIVDYMKKNNSAALTEIFIGGVNSERLTINAGETIRYSLTIIAKNTSTGAAKEWKADGLIKNVGGTTSMVGSQTNVSTWADASMASASLGVSADNTNDSLLVEVTGIAATTINWYGRLDYVKGL
jgi:hypothetical protein